MGNWNEPKPRGLGTAIYKTRNNNYRQVLGTFNIPLGYIKKKCGQESMEEDDIVRIVCVCVFNGVATKVLVLGGSEV